MPVMDEFKKEREAMKNGTPKEKLSYFWDYYKWHVIVGSIVVILAISLIHQMATRKETAFYACLLNASEKEYTEDKTKYTGAFAEYAGIDTDTCDILYDSSIRTGTGSALDYESSQKLMVYIASAEIDVMVSDFESLRNYAYQGNFLDLRDFLSEEQLKKYQDSIYYIDGAVMRELETASETFDYEYVPSYGDPRRPENMEEPIPAGIFLKEDCPLLQDYSFRGQDVTVSALINTKRPELASAFIDFLMQ